jgi:intracellular septation protein
MQALFDLLPAVVFFVVYRFYGIYAATAAIMVTLALQLAYQWLRHRKVTKLFLATTVIVWVFGTITLALRNPLFIQWKPTIVSGLFALAFLGSHFVGSRKTLIERAMSESFQLDAGLYRQLSVMWIGTFALLAAANLYIVYNFSEEVWVNFKVFGITGVTLLVALAQGIWVYVKTPQSDPQQDR